jgi:cytochrome c-type biogenesis protein CcmH/NrfG
MRYWPCLVIALGCAQQETADASVGCLARAIQLDPYRRDLWVALDRAIARSGRATITDAELTRAALVSEAPGCPCP